MGGYHGLMVMEDCDGMVATVVQQQQQQQQQQQWLHL
jgi:hypothetical protein